MNTDNLRYLRGIANILRPSIPLKFDALEVVAAAFPLAAASSNDSEPGGHNFNTVIPQYLATLPRDTDEAIAVIKVDAARALSLPGLADDHARLAAAKLALLEAEIEVSQAQAIQGQRINRLHRLDQIILEAQQELVRWDLDFDSWASICLNAISEGYAKDSDIMVVQDAFRQLAQIPVLRSLAPAAVAKITASITDAERERAELHASTPAAVAEPAPVTLTRGRQKLPQDAPGD